MREAIEQLMRPGGLSVARRFRRARAFWKNFFAQHGADSAADLAKAVGRAQFSYELLFGHERALAKESMPFTCFGALYDTHRGWLPKPRAFALRLARAFKASHVSLEVKFSLVEAVATYDLHEYDDDLLVDVRGRYGA
jgi:hypothetical protein